MALRVVSAAVFFGCTVCLVAQSSVPSPYPVDLDGDAVSSIGDRIAFQLWVDSGGDEREALRSATVQTGPAGTVFGLAGFFEGLQKTSQSADPGENGGAAQALVGNGVDTSITLLELGSVPQPAVSEIRLWRGNRGEPSAGTLDWTVQAFDDSDWESVNTTPIGFPSQPFNLSDMQNNYTSFYVRIKFRPAGNTQFDADFFSSLEYELGVDDGFVAYVNGQEVRRNNTSTGFPALTRFFGDNVPYVVGSTAARENPVTTRISGYTDLFNTNSAIEPLVNTSATNVLAIHVMNRTLANADCILSPRILARKRGPFLARSQVNTAQSPDAHVPTDVEVCFRASQGLFDSIRVEYFLSGSPGTVRTSNEVSIDSDFDTPFVDETLYRVQLPGANSGTPNPALPIATQVTYRVFVGSKRFEEDDLTFRTPDSFDSPFTFVLVGNSGIPGEVQANLAGVMQSLGADVYITCGDQNIRNNRYTATTQIINERVEPALNQQSLDHRFYNPHAQTMAGALFYVAPGEDDLETSTSNGIGALVADYDAAYVLPKNDVSVTNEPGDGSSEKFYSFEYGNIHFTVVDSYFFNHVTLSTEALVASEPMAFLQADLTNTNKFWKVVIIYHPVYTSKTTDTGGEGEEDDNQNREDLETFGGLEELGVDLVISAREDVFELTHAVRTNGSTIQVMQTGPHFLNPGAPVYMITGGGGEPLYQCVPGPGCEPIQNFTMAVRELFHVVQITSHDNVLTIQPLRQDGTVEDIDPNPDAGKTSSSITKTTFRSFRRGDGNQDGTVNIADAVFGNLWLFSGGAAAHCIDAVDSNDDGLADIADSVWTLNHLFNGGPPPPPPGTANCGQDPTSDTLSCLEYHAACP